MVYLNFKPQIPLFNKKENYLEDYNKHLKFVMDSYILTNDDKKTYSEFFQEDYTWDEWLEELEKCKSEDINDIENYLKEEYNLQYLNNLIQYLVNSPYSPYTSLDFQDINSYHDVRNLENEALYCMKQANIVDRGVVRLEL